MNRPKSSHGGANVAAQIVERQTEKLRQKIALTEADEGVRQLGSLLYMSIRTRVAGCWQAVRAPGLPHDCIG